MEVIKNFYQHTSWAEVKQDVRNVNPTLYDIIENMTQSQSLKLIKGHYTYGSDIYEANKIVEQELGTLLSPLMLQMDKSCERYLTAGDRVIPLDLYSPGNLIGLDQSVSILNQTPKKPQPNISAGARSAFMLPKITDARAHKRLNNNFQFNLNPPTDISEHWHIFKAITSHISHRQDPWHTTLLLFPQEWLQKALEEKWLEFQNFILLEALKELELYNFHNGICGTWEIFANTIRCRNLKPGPYLTDTIKHILMISENYIPGYKIINNDENILPSHCIQHAYSEVYQLKDYAPFLMAPSKISAQNSNAIYYSLGYPTLIEGTPTIRKPPSIITELREIKKLMSILNEILEEKHCSESYLKNQSTYEYYHSEDDPFGEIKNSQDILYTSLDIKEELEKQYQNKTFSTYNQFFRGCISIKNSKQSCKSTL